MTDTEALVIAGIAFAIVWTWPYIARFIASCKREHYYYKTRRHDDDD